MPAPRPLSRVPAKVSKLRCALVSVLIFIVCNLIANTQFDGTIGGTLTLPNPTSLPASSNKESKAVVGPLDWCHLDPQWGFPSSTDPKNCTGKTPKHPFTTAVKLSCSVAPMHTSVSNWVSSTNASSLIIGILYYAEPALLLQQLEHFSNLPTNLKQQIQIWILDDGSPAGLDAESVITMHHRQKMLQNLHLLRINTNIAWNMPGARNLIMHLASQKAMLHDSSLPLDRGSSRHQDKILLIDLDLLVPEQVLWDILTWPTMVTPDDYSKDSDKLGMIAHTLNRRKLDGSYKVHPSAMVLSSKAWWSAGGMDEDFSTHYGSEDTAFWFRFSTLRPDTNQVIYHNDSILQQVDLPPCDANWLSDTVKRQSCEQARSDLPKTSRSTNYNIVKLRNKLRTGCWSNTFLQYPWTIVF